MQEVAGIEEHPLLHVMGMRPGAAFPAELQWLQYAWVIAELDDEVCSGVRGRGSGPPRCVGFAWVDVDRGVVARGWGEGG